MAEEEQSLVSTMSRQFLRTHRPFRAVIMDRTGKPILWVCIEGFDHEARADDIDSPAVPVYQLEDLCIGK